ncbi:MAG: hypothetical protein CM1200mP6_01830 [Anaerolineaceae bacterium]|nr:MAG: hypothetical protein CM1200mP6_01830 [Anaerolineaceae bacterium]
MSAVNCQSFFLADMSAEDAKSWLMRFKGVGPKTAAIVLLFSLDQHAFPVEHMYIECQED